MSDDEKGVRLFGAPRPEKFPESEVGQALLDSARIHYKDRADQRRLVAVEKLALDIFADPSAARAFAVNPEEYLRRSGFEDVTLDLNSQEVRAAMAMGDPVVREAAHRGDVEAFLKAVVDQGLTPSVDQLMPVLAFELAALLSVVAATWAGVGFSVAAGMWVYAAAAVKTKIAVQGLAPGRNARDYVDLISNLAATLTDRGFAANVRTAQLEAVVEEYLNLEKAMERRKETQK